MLYFNDFKKPIQGNYHCSGSTHKKPLGSCGGDWEGYEVEKKKEIKYFRGLWSTDFFLFEDTGSVCQTIFQSPSKTNTLNEHRTWLKTHPEEPLIVTACLHLLFLPDRKRLKKNSPQLFLLEKKKKKRKWGKLNERKLYRTKKVKHLQAVQGLLKPAR